MLVVVGVLAAAPAGAVTRSRAADPGEYPAQAALLAPSGAAYCGATVIDPSWVLTAGHCVAGRALPIVLTGTNRLDGGGQRIAADRAVVHPGYGFPRNDVAVVHLSRPTTAPPTPLAYDGMEALETPGTPASITGWGRLSAAGVLPVDLREGDVPVLADADCDAALAEHGSALADPGGQVCAGAGRAASNPEEADACQGDSGGPLWAAGADGVRRQIGIVSGGPTCGRSPSYYTSVEVFVTFVESAIGRHLASYVDVPGDAHEVGIERVTLAGFAGGIGAGRFAPAAGVSRAQMASFLARALRLAPVLDGPFVDVDGDRHEGAINAVAAAGIAGGFGDGTYRPELPVTRGQMAAFLARALRLEPVAGTRFADTAGDAHEPSINAVAAAGIAGGFADGTYRPLAGVTRGQMATFLDRAF